MKKLFIILLFLLAVNCFSQSDKDFKYIANDNDGAKIYITSQEKDGECLRFWISHIIPVRPVKNIQLKEIFFGGNRELMLVELNCTARTYNLIKVISYDLNGKVEKSDDVKIKHEKIYPGSFMDIIATEVCKL
ncbi:hypothetical protein [Flavobacterium salmonis]|uniref:Uncharacterized protein n=1 Tax=Flavobacterium salmonis TaxID=2654844 RepID=A0A6V6Z5A9_9FLAO|nr:hypothetical protein [Flavobacterium salmonis]CAD0006980.1 hypothetical protein FLAT13_03621 [Flavobacterium salmonis]